MSSSPVEVDPESFTFTIKGVQGLVFAIHDLNLDIDRDWIDVGWSPFDRIPGLTEYKVTIRARRVR